jgi:peptide/nickel transport system ATP-binding protein
VVADEPTSALDVTTAASILTLLRGLAQPGTAIVVISHDQDTLAVLADRVLSMAAGRLAVP